MQQPAPPALPALLSGWPPLVCWPGLTGYATAVTRQQAAVEQVLAGGGEQLIFCEHPAVFTLGSSGSTAEVLAAGATPVIESGRGGKTTYHGPGQRVIYPILDLNQRGRDLHQYVQNLQNWVGAVVQEAGLELVAEDEVGVWVKTPKGPAKIAAIGVRVKRWVSYHGVALNVDPELAAFGRIVPCGIRDKGVTSLAEMGVGLTMGEVDRLLFRHFPAYFPAYERIDQPSRQGADAGT